jgi:hypothetical protein
LSELVAAAQLILKLPIEQCTMDNRYIHFVIHNRHEMHEGMHHCLVCGPCLSKRGMLVGLRLPWFRGSHFATPPPLPHYLSQDTSAELFSAQYSSFDPTLYIAAVCLLVAEIIFVIAPIVAKVSAPA